MLQKISKMVLLSPLSTPVFDDFEAPSVPELPSAEEEPDCREDHKGSKDFVQQGSGDLFQQQRPCNRTRDAARQKDPGVAQIKGAP